MSIKKVVEIDLNVKKAVEGFNELSGTLTDQKEILLELEREYLELDRQMKEIPKSQLAARSALAKQQEHLRDSIKDQKLSLRELRVEREGYSNTLKASKIAIEDATHAHDGNIHALTQNHAFMESLDHATGGFASSAHHMGELIEGTNDGLKVMGVNLIKTAAGQKALTAATWLGNTATKALNAVMNANPVFLLITGIGLLSTAIIAFAKDEEKAEEATNKLNAALEQQQTLIDRNLAAARQRWEGELKLMQAQGKTEEELHDKRLDNLNKEETAAKFLRDREKLIIDERKKNYEQALKEGNSELATSIKEEIKESKNRYHKLDSQLKDHINNKQIEEVKHSEFLKKERKERYDNWKAWKDKQIGIEREIIDARLALIEDDEERELNILNEKWEQQRADLLKDTDKTQEQKNTLLKLWDAKRVQDEDEIRDKYVEKEKQKFIDSMPPPDGEIVDVEAVEKTGEEEEIRMGLLFNIREKWRKKEGESDQAHRDRIKAQADEGLGNAMQGLQALDGLNNALTDAAVKKAGSNEAAAEKARKKGFERSKKLQMTMAIIQGVQGVMAAFTAGSSMGPAGVIMGPVMATLAAVTAGINVAKISKMKYEGGGSAGGGGGGSVPRAPSVPSPANFNVVGNSGTNQLAETLGEQPPIEAQVVGEKVTTQQSLDRNRIENASL